MHPADVSAAVKKRGSNLVQLSLAAGLNRSAIAVSFTTPFIRAEQALIEFLGLPPQDIYPGRYDADGVRTVKRGKAAHKNYKPATRKARKR